MDKTLNKLISTVIPKSKIRLIITIIMTLGIIMGIIYFLALNNSDYKAVTNEVNNIFNNDILKNINSLEVLKNSIVLNLIFLFAIYLLGISIIGIPFIAFLAFLKSFTLSFTISSIISVYKFKGIFGSFVYIFPGNIINLLLILILSIYSINHSLMLIGSITKKKNINYKHEFSKYSIIFGIGIIITLLTSLSDTYINPFLIKLFIKMFL